MQKLIIGRAKTGKTTQLMECVRSCPAYGMSERIVIVPEQLSHQTERILSQVCDDSISYTAEVLSFTRLQNRVSSIYGGNARKTLDEAGRLLTARLAVTTIRSRLKVFAPASSKTEFLTGILSMIDEFKSYDVTPQMLQAAANRESGTFSQKLLELSEILGAYDAVMAQGTLDPRDRLNLLYDQICDTQYAEDRWFFIDGFIDFSGQELRVIDALMHRCKSMVVTLPSDGERFENNVFSSARGTMSRLITMAKACGRKVQIIETTYQRTLPPALTFLERNLFQFGTEKYEDFTDAIHIFSAEDRIEECIRCASELKQLAISGIRWRDMAVACGNPECYAGILEAVFQENGIPVYTGVKKLFTSHPAVAFVLNALEAATEGMERESVIACFRTHYCDLTPDECDLLDNYTYTWSVSGSKWGNEWSEHPEGYDGWFTDQTKEELAFLNELRERACGPLIRLSSGIRTAANVHSQINALYMFIDEIGLLEKIKRQVALETESGDMETAQETAQVWNTMLECLQQIVSVLGPVSVNGSEFLKILRTALSKYEIGTIPAVLDSVSFGSMDSLRGAEPKVLYVLGVNEGVIPTEISRSSLLTEQERSALKEHMQISLAPAGDDLMERQLLQIYSTFSSPCKKLYLSFSQSQSGDSLKQSYLIERILRLFPKLRIETKQSILPAAITEQQLTQIYLSAEEQDDHILQSLIEQAALSVPSLSYSIIRAKNASAPRDLLVPKQLAERMFGKEAALTASRLDQIAKCPLSFFLNYGLKAKSVKEAAFDATEYGTFVHYILEKTVADIVAADSEKRMDESKCKALVLNYMDSYIQQRLHSADSLSARERYLYLRNADEAGRILSEITDELSVSDFTPCAFELEFGKGTEMGDLTVHTSLGAGRLDGTVDRVDLWKSSKGDYFRIIDYKSGTKKFDYTDLWNGVGLQLFLYLFAIRRSGIPKQSEKPVPAGALYLPTRRTVQTVEAGLSDEESEKRMSEKDPKRSGLVLSDPAVLAAMERDGTRYLPVKKTDKPGDYAITEAQMDVLENYIEKQMMRAVDRIYSGQFQPEPYYRSVEDNVCNYCDYSDVCQKDPDFRKRFYAPKISAQDFWDKIGGDEDA